MFKFKIADNVSVASLMQALACENLVFVNSPHHGVVLMPAPQSVGELANLSTDAIAVASISALAKLAGETL